MSALDIASCQEHENAIEVRVSSTGHECVDCGKLIWIAVCLHCRKWFIDWRVSGEDDVMSSAHYAQDGALLCVGCVGQHDADEMEFEGDYISNDYSD